MATARAHHIAEHTWLLFAYWCDLRIAGWRFVITSDGPDSPVSRHSIGVWLTDSEACHAYRDGDVAFTSAQKDS